MVFDSMDAVIRFPLNYNLIIFPGADEYGRHFAKTETQDEYGTVSGKFISNMDSRPINIRWIRTGSKPYKKIMYRIVFYIQFSTNIKNIQS